MFNICLSFLRFFVKNFNFIAQQYKFLMGKSQLILLSLLAVSAVVIFNLKSDLKSEQSAIFQLWKAKMNKNYDQAQNQFRLQIWIKNYNYVKEHNKNYQAGLESFDIEMNKFADLTDEQFVSKYMGYDASLQNTTKCTGAQVPLTDIPAQVNWIPRGAVTPIKDQGECGSCWAFSAVGSLQGAHFLSTNSLISFSQQQLVDCSRYVNNGCHGGIMDGAFYYVKDHGITLESKYPYKGIDQDCTYDESQKVWGISDCTDVTPEKQNYLMAAIAKHPVSVPVDAAHIAFRLYKKGVFNGYCGTNLGHGILAVGYGEQSGKKYYRVKNSWGVTWGDDGFMLIQRKGDGKGHCGVQIAPKFPLP